MRDVSHKVNTLRTAVARATLRVSPSTIEQIHTNTLPKGNPLPVAKVAAIQAAKNTSQIIPYCHPLPVEFVGVEFRLEADKIEIEVTVKAVYKTGVEMEALTAASVAALTIYDMAKMVDDLMQIENTILVSKTGGKSDYADRSGRTGQSGKKRKAAVLVLSDRASAGKTEDRTGPQIAERLKREDFDVLEVAVLADNQEEIETAVRRLCDDARVHLLITTGGTGIGPRDNTPEALSSLIDRELPGVAETIRQYGQERNLFAMLSRATAGLRKDSMIISLPGSPTAVEDGLNVIFPVVHHAFSMLKGEGHEKHVH